MSIMRNFTAVAVCGGLALFAACGGGDPVQGPTESGESPTLDFSAIAGTWAGWGLEANGVNFWIRASLSGGAGIGEVVGSIEYGTASTDSEPDCLGDWRAVDTDHPAYTVDETITVGRQGGGSGCPDGTVRLVLDPATGELSYEFTPDQGGAAATGTLRRGTDPGPRP